jgi:hypothetical protein
MKRGILLIALFFILFSFNVSATLIAHYPFNGGATDSTGYGHHGTLVGGMNCNAPGVDGTACDFSGNEDYVEVVNGILDIGYTEFTVAGWIKQDINNIIDARHIFRQGNMGDPDRGFLAQLYYDPERMFFYQSIDGDLQNTNTAYDFPHDDEWHHIAFSYEYDDLVSTTRVYLDGDLMNTRVEEGHGPPDYPDPTDSFYFGKKRNTDGYAGLMDEFRVYNNKLRDDQVEALYWEYKDFSTDQIYILDNLDLTGGDIVGEWTHSSSSSGHYGSDYLHDGNTTGGGKSVKYQPILEHYGEYDVYIWYPDYSTYASNAPVEIHHAEGIDTIEVDQRSHGGLWILLGRYEFDAANHKVVIKNDGADGYVIADAVMFSRAGPRGCTIPVSEGSMMIWQDTLLCLDTYNFDKSDIWFYISDDATLDCNGATLEGETGSAFIAISGYGNNMGVRNCKVRNFGIGVELNGDNIIIENNDFDNNEWAAVSSGVDVNSYVNIRRNVILGGEYGIYSYGHGGNTLIEDNYISDANVGVDFLGYGGEQVDNNYVCNNVNLDLECWDSSLRSRGINNVLTSSSDELGCSDVRGEFCGSKAISSDDCSAAGGTVLDSGCGPGFVSYGGTHVFDEPMASPGRIMDIPSVAEGGIFGGEVFERYEGDYLDCLKSDFNGDLAVTVADFGVFATCFNQRAVGDCARMDLSGNDGLVTVADFSAYAGAHNVCDYSNWYVGDCCIRHDSEIECNDGIDNNLNGLTDADDPGCGRGERGMMDFEGTPRCFSGVEGEYGGYVDLCNPDMSPMDQYDETGYTNGDGILQAGEACNIRVLDPYGGDFLIHAVYPYECDIETYQHGWYTIGDGENNLFSFEYSNNEEVALSCYELNEAYTDFHGYVGTYYSGLDWASDWAGPENPAGQPGDSWHDAGNYGWRKLCSYCGDGALTLHETSNPGEAEYDCNDPNFIIDTDWDDASWKCYCSSDSPSEANNGVCEPGETDEGYYFVDGEVPPGEGNGCELENTGENMCVYGVCDFGECVNNCKSEEMEDSYCYPNSGIGQYCNGACECIGPINICGDGELDPPENCDCGDPWNCVIGGDYNLGGQDCTNHEDPTTGNPFHEGELDCNPWGGPIEQTCQFDTSLCWSYDYFNENTYSHYGDSDCPFTFAFEDQFVLQEATTWDELLIGIDVRASKVGSTDIYLTIDGFGGFNYDYNHEDCEGNIGTCPWNRFTRSFEDTGILDGAWESCKLGCGLPMGTCLSLPYTLPAGTHTVRAWVDRGNPFLGGDVDDIVVQFKNFGMSGNS